MHKKAFALLLFLALLNIARAETICGEVPIDDFEDGDASDWKMLYDMPDADKNVTLSDFAHGGSYSIRLWNGPIGYAIDFNKDGINATINQTYRYYNLSFWYYAEAGCSYPDDHDIYISDESSFDPNWRSAVINTGCSSGAGCDNPSVNSMSCGSWNYISQSIEDTFWWKDTSFSLDSSFLGSINFEIMQGSVGNMVYYDDIKLIPTVPETNWTCTDWSTCMNNTQHRTCVDGCGAGLNKPAESQSCTCTPDWQCGPWSICSNGVQTRSCNDVNQCGTLTGQPAAQQACPLNPTSATVTVSPMTINRGGDVAISATATDADGISYAGLYITDADGISDNYLMSRSGNVFTYNYNLPTDAPLGVYQVRVLVEDSKGESSWFIGDNFTVVNYINVQLSTDKSLYNQSETVHISGTTRDAAGDAVPAECQLNFSSGNWVEAVVVSSDGEFTYNGVISLVDPTGEWQVTATCSGASGMGSDSASITVSAPTRYEYYNVIINSPVMGSIYYQGENVRLTSNVKAGEDVVSGATVFAILPTGDRLQMEETANGVYSEVLGIPADAETGNWNMVVRAIKGNYTGENTVNITVRPSVVNLAVLEPIVFSLIPGETMTIKVNATRSDGSAVTGLSLHFGTPSGDVPMTEVGNGIYQVFYTASELGAFDLAISGAGSLQYTQRTITVREPTILDYLRIYWYLPVVGAVAVAAVSYPLARKRVRTGRTKNLIAEKKRVQTLQKELQRAYFKGGDMDRQTFDKRSQEYEEQLRKLDEETKSKSARK